MSVAGFRVTVRTFFSLLFTEKEAFATSLPVTVFITGTLILEISFGSAEFPLFPISLGKEIENDAGTFSTFPSGIVVGMNVF